jgi:HSP20 family protein
MNLWIWKPAWQPFSDLERQMSRLIDLTLNVVGQQMAPTWRPFPTGNVNCNLYETPGAYLLLLPMPGVKADELDVQVVGNTLTVEGERTRPDVVADELYRRQERWQGRWSRVIQLPEKADPTKVAASLEHGLLLVRLPKVPETPARQFPVRIQATHQSNAPTAVPARNGNS